MSLCTMPHFFVYFVALDSCGMLAVGGVNMYVSVYVRVTEWCFVCIYVMCVCVSVCGGVDVCVIPLQLLVSCNQTV